MRKYSILTLLGMLLVIVAIPILIVFYMGPGIKFAPDWVLNVTFIWLVGLAGYVVGLVVERFKN